ncbi:MAG: UDP-N-acetylglucosamine 1-carboxyvinyltransferase [Planctomycetota bacterium]
MDSMVIEGPTRLKGEVTVSGSKNAALPIMAACLLAGEKCTLSSVPELADTELMSLLLEQLGARVEATGPHSLTIETTDERQVLAHYDIVRKMRASVCVLGPLLARRKKAVVSLPGGCVIGDRPIDLHLKGLAALGAHIREENGYVIAEARKLRGGNVFLGGRHGSTVLGTANVLCAAVLATGTTVIDCAACEPEIADLARFLNRMGAKISGMGSPRLTIRGVTKLRGASYRLIPDRIEGGTLIIAAAMAGGGVTVRNVRADHLSALLDKLREIGVEVETDRNSCRVGPVRRLHSTEFATLPYPGFPTDLQAQMLALLSGADGLSIITEKVFPDRFMHVPELNRLGANIIKEGSTAILKGPRTLHGAEVMASDLRASAALVLAGLAATGKTTVNRIYHLDRGYERFHEKLQALGARVDRVSE